VNQPVLTCYKHPQIETSLRCNKCERPICARCAVQTPVGYRCAECVRGQQAVFETARGYDYAVAVVLGAVGVGLAVFLLSFLDVWGILLAPVFGGMLAGVIRIAVRRRRSQQLPFAASLGGVLAVLGNIGLILASVAYALGQSPSLSFVLSQGLMILWPLAHGFLVIIVMYFRLKANRA
jgi:hypothetical protein